MAMEITGNYSSYAAENKTETAEKMERKSTYENSKEYSDHLYRKFGCLKPTKDTSVTINSSLLSKAASDQKTAEWLEHNLSLIPDVVNSLNMSAAARGTKMISCNIRIEGYDSMTTEMVTRSETDSGTEEAKKHLEEARARNKERRKGWEKAQEKKQEKEKLQEEVLENLQTKNIVADSADTMLARSGTEEFWEKKTTGQTAFDVKA